MSRTTSLLGITAGMLLLLLLVFYWPFLSNGASFYISDISLLQYPLDSYLSERMRGGHWPLWNPFILAGMPAGAFMSPSPFYFFQFLFALFPFNAAYAIQLIVNHMAALVGGYLLIDALGWGRKPALLFGASFALCGLLFSLQAVPSLMAVAAWLPLALFAVVKLHQQSARRQRLLFCALLSLAAYFIIEAGSLDVAALELALLCAWSLRVFLLAPVDRREKITRLSLTIAGLALAVLMAMAQLVPQMEWAALSPRAGGLSSNQVLDLSANWYDLLGLLLPHPLGDRLLADNPFLRVTESYRNPNTYLPSVFLGPVILALAFWGLCDKRWRLRWAVLATIVVACFASLGEHTVVIPYLVQHFGLRLFRFPVKLLLFPVLLFLLAAARGLSAFPDNVSIRTIKNSLLLWLGTLVAGTALLIPVSAEPIARALQKSLFGNTQAPVSDLMPAAAPAIGWSLVLSSLLALCLGGLAVLVERKKATPAMLGNLCLTCAVALFVWHATAVLQHEAPRDYFSMQSELAKKLRSAATEGAVTPRFVSLTWAGHMPRHYLTGDNLTARYYQFARRILTPLSNIDARIDALGANQYVDTRENGIIFDRAYRLHVRGDDLALATYCRMTATNLVVDYMTEGVRGPFFVRHRQLDPRYFTLVDTMPSLNCVMYTVKGPLPRAYFAALSKWGQPHDAVVSFVSEPARGLFDPRRLTILEHPGENQTAPAGVEMMPGKVAWLKNEPEEITLSAQTATANYLVLADTFYPGWQATVDGHPTALYEANGFTRAVYVPAGTHVVGFNFRPKSVTFGVCLSALGLLAWLAIMLCARFCFSHASKESVAP